MHKSKDCLSFCLSLNCYIYIYIYYSVQLNRSLEYLRQDKKSFNYEDLNFPGKELNATYITEKKPCYF